jgi:hypothetical protein
MKAHEVIALTLHVGDARLVASVKLEGFDVAEVGPLSRPLL